MRSSIKELKMRIIKFCQESLNKYLQDFSNNTERNLLLECINKLNQVDSDSSEDLALALVELNEKIVASRNIAYRYIWKFFNSVDGRGEPAGPLRIEIESALYKLLNKGVFMPTAEDLETRSSPMTTRNEVIDYFEKRSTALTSF